MSSCSKTTLRPVQLFHDDISTCPAAPGQCFDLSSGSRTRGHCVGNHDTFSHACRRIAGSEVPSDQQKVDVPWKSSKGLFVMLRVPRACKYESPIRMNRISGVCLIWMWTPNLCAQCVVVGRLPTYLPCKCMLARKKPIQSQADRGRRSCEV